MQCGVPLELFLPACIWGKRREQPLSLDTGINAPNIVLASTVGVLAPKRARGGSEQRGPERLSGLAAVRRGARPESKPHRLWQLGLATRGRVL